MKVKPAVPKEIDWGNVKILSHHVWKVREDKETGGYTVWVDLRPQVRYLLTSSRREAYLKGWEEGRLNMKPLTKHESNKATKLNELKGGEV